MFDRSRKFYRQQVPRWFRRRVFSWMRGAPLDWAGGILPVKITYRELTFTVKLVRCPRQGKIEMLFYDCEVFPDQRHRSGVEIIGPDPRGEYYTERTKYL